MFRFAILAFVTLRVTLCPLFCAVCASDAHCRDASAPCCCCETGNQDSVADGEPTDSSEQPSHSEHPCCPGSICQVLIDVNQRLADIVDVDWHDVLPLASCEVVEPIADDSRIDDRAFRHPFQSGRDTRLIFASLLL